MGSPRVSFVVTCFNLGAYLPETLASVRAQTFTDFEICVVDDGSTDEQTLRVLGEVGPGVTLVRTENRGLSAARNRGVASTSGEFVCAVDADDLLLPTLVEKSVARLDGDPSLAFVSHWLEAFGDQSWTWTPEDCDLVTLLDTNTVNGAALVRRTAVEAAGGWDDNLRHGLEDWDFWITLVERGFRGAIIPEVLFRYRQRPDSMSRVHFADGGHARLYRRLVDKHPDSFGRHVTKLVARRQADRAAAWAAAADVNQELELQLLPALARARDDVVMAERRRARWRAEDDHRPLNGEVTSLRMRLEAARDEAIALDHRRHHAEQEVAELRSSLSWRITRPLRVLGGLVARRGRRPPSERS